MPVLKSTLDGTAWAKVVGPEGNQGPPGPTGPTTVGRNRLINSDFSINQRAFASSVVNGGYGFDRWAMECYGGTNTYSAQAFAVGDMTDATSFARIVTSGQSAVNHYTTLYQRIEDVRLLAGKTATASFWAKAASGAPKVSVVLSQRFGTGGSTTTMSGFGYTNVTLSTSWARYAITSTVRSISADTIGTAPTALEFSLWLSTGSNYSSITGGVPIQSNTFDLWGFQFEEGAVATPYEQRTVHEELRACKRYFQRWQQPPLRGATGASNTAGRLGMILPVSMRAAPTLTLSGSLPMWNGSVTGTATAIGTTYNTPMSIQFDPVVTWTTAATLPAIVYQSGASYLDLNAEL